MSAPAYQPRYSSSTVPRVSVVSITRAEPYSASRNSRVSICTLSFDRSAGVRVSAFSPGRITSASRSVSAAGSVPTRAYSVVASIHRSWSPGEVAGTNTMA